MDPVTGNELSGLTITNTDTAESHVSACGGVTFTPVAPPNNYAITAGDGTDCVTANLLSYDASPTNAEPIGDESIVLSRAALQVLRFTIEEVASGNVVRDVPVQNADTLEIQTATCSVPATFLPQAGPWNINVLGGAGTDCVTSIVRTYAPDGTFNPGPGSVSVALVGT